MKINKEGRVVFEDGKITKIENFSVEGGGVSDLQEYVEKNYHFGCDTPSSSPWQQALALVEKTGVKPSDSAYADVLALALEQVDITRNDLESYVNGRKAGLYEAERQSVADVIVELESQASRFKQGAECLGDEAKGAKFQLLSCAEMLLKRAKEIENGAEVANSYAGNCGEGTMPAGMDYEPSGNGQAGDGAVGFGNKIWDWSQTTDKSAVEISGYRYGFDNEGPWRQKLRTSMDEVNKPLPDCTFAAPVKGLMKEKGFTTDVRIWYDLDSNAVMYTQRINGERISFAYIAEVGKWAPPIIGEGLHRGGVQIWRTAPVPAISEMYSGTWGSPYNGEGGLIDLPDEDKPKLPAFDANGIATKGDVCCRCEGALGGRTSVCEKCEPSRG